MTETPTPSTSALEAPLTDPDRDDTVVVSDGGSFGTIVLEYVNDPHDGHTYALTRTGNVLRMFYGSPWKLYYTVHPDAVAEHVASVRLAKHQRVTADRWRGPVPDIERPGWIREKKEEPVAETKTAPKEKKAAPKEKAAAPKSNGKAPRLGANAKRVLEGGLDLTKARQAEVLTAANALAVARGDSITRIWDVYEAAGVALPEKVASAKAEYTETGRMPKSGGGAGRGNAQAAPSKSSGKANPSPSTMPSEQPESKPTADTESVPGPAEPTPQASDDETL